MPTQNQTPQSRTFLNNNRKNTMHFALLLMFSIAAAIALGFHPLERITSVPSGKETLEGIDVSNHQGAIEWGSLDQNKVNFVFIKATEGMTFTDKSFAINWQGSAEAGFLRGAYHFYRFESGGKEQAEHFIKVVPLDDFALPPVVDLEIMATDGPNLIKELKIYIKLIENHYERKPIFYCNKDTYNAYVKVAFPDYPVWYADYNSPPPIDGWDFWQFTDSGTLTGIEGNVDFNQFSGTSAELFRLAGIKQ